MNVETLIERRAEEQAILPGMVSREEWRRITDDIIERERAALAGGSTWGRWGPWERDRALNERGLDSVLRNIIRAGERPDIVATRGYAMGMDVNDFPPSSFTAVNTTTSETGLWTPNIWSPAPANDPRAGKAYKVSFGGILGTSSSAPTATWTPRWTQSTAVPPTGTTLGASTGTTLIASLSSVPVYGEFTLGWRTLGLAASGGTATGNGFVCMGGLTTAAGIIQVIGGTAASSVDQTTAQGLLVSITWSASNASNTVTCQWVVMQSLN